MTKLTDAERAARSARLVYVTDSEPGISRQKRGKGFEYMDVDGRVIRNPDEIARINAIVIPPAWTEVWICPNPDGHILATGRDEKGRKQYRYHPRWAAKRSDSNFDRMLTFAEHLPTIREVTDAHLRQRSLSREKLLAVVVRLLETTLIRIGNREYARQNDSYGLTTLQDDHVAVHGKKIQFEFRGKSGKEHLIDLEDARLARVIKACRNIPGYTLFQYYDEMGERHKISSTDVNAYLHEITGEYFTAKDFRTWGGSVQAVAALCALDPAERENEAKQRVNEAVKQVARALGNTTAVCRKHYIHPAVVNAFLKGTLGEACKQAKADRLRPDEAVFVALLRD